MGKLDSTLFKGRFVMCVPKVPHGLEIERIMNY